MPVQDLFRCYDNDGKLIHIRAGQGYMLQQAHGTSGMICQLLSASAGQYLGFQPYVVSLEHPIRNTAKITQRGTQVIYMLEGLIKYRYGRRDLVLAPGDGAVSDANTLHGPVSVRGGKARYFCMLLNVELTSETVGPRRMNVSAG